MPHSYSLHMPPSQAPAEVMHIDLNSAFAMTEQQSNPFLRGRPVGVTNRLNDYAICIAASYEAKRVGIGLGTRRPEALLRSPLFVMKESDPAKYQHVHRKMKSIFESYSPVAYMKSVDEGIIDFRGMAPILKGRPLEDIAMEIKQRVRDEVGSWMTVNVGIAQNRWLAKVAAGFMKPDGLYTIDADNLEMVYHMMDLMDLPYIKKRNKLRLAEAGIYTPYEFYQAPEVVLTRRVFKSINGHHWYLKLRGYETEVEYGIRTVGRSYVLEHRTADPEELSLLFHKACHKLAWRLKKNDFAARGLSLNLRYGKTGGGWGGRHGSGWHERHTWKTAVRRGDELYARTIELFNRSPRGRMVTGLFLTSYGLEPAKLDQPTLFDDWHTRRERVEDAMNVVNRRYGEETVVPAAFVASKNPMRDKIPFGTIRYFED